MKKNKKWFYLVLGLMIVATVTVGFASKSLSQPSSKLPLGKPLKIGAAIPLSGPGVPWGVATLRGSQYYIDAINAEGGLVVAGERHMIEFKYYDHKYRADEAATVTRRLIMQDGCGYLHMTGGGMMPAVAGIIQDSPVLCFSASWGLGILNPSFDHFWNYVSQPPELTYVWKWFAEKRPGIKRVAVVAVNDNVGRMSAMMIERRTKEFGLTFTGVEYYERDITDFSAALSRLLAKNPDIIDVDGSPTGTVALILKQARERGYKGGFIHNSMTDPAIVVKMVGPEIAEGLYAGAALPPQGEWYYKKYIDKFKEWDNMSPVYGSYVSIITQAMKKANSLDHKEVKAVLESPDFVWDELFGGKGRFYGKDEPLYGISHQALVPEYLGQVRGGKFEYVTTYGHPLLSLPKQ